VALHIVIEIHKDIQPAAAPFDDSVGPRLQGSLTVTEVLRGRCILIYVKSLVISSDLGIFG